MSLINYLKETKEELKEVTWPSKRQTTIWTILVIVISTIVAVFLGAIDFGLKDLLSVLIK